MPTPYHARYFAHELSRQAPSTGVDRLSASLFDAAVDLNPHQIEAALFALRSPFGGGVLLADEVGLGKTIEAGLVLCQLWAERRRRLLVICPAALRKQWALELAEKFNLPASVLDAATWRQAQREGQRAPFDTPRVVVVSYQYASALQAELRAVEWDLVVLDEAHKLRNAYRPSHRIGQRLRWALEGRRKLLLTATPLQNSLLELYGLTSLLDEHVFGDVAAFRGRYLRQDADLGDLRKRLAAFCQRTLRNQVGEYVRYTERRAVTHPFRPTDDEHGLYEAVSALLAREDAYAVPSRQRALATIVLRKLLASSSHAVAGTLDAMRARLARLRDGGASDGDALFEQFVLGEELGSEYLEGDEPDTATDDGPDAAESTAPAADAPGTLDLARLDAEIAELTRYATWARAIGVDTKSRALLSALDVGFAEMARTGAARKALVFTESRRTQEYVRQFLEANGYAGHVVVFNGGNADAASREVYDRWVRANEGSGRVTGSRAVDVRTALVEEFRDRTEVMIATEAGAEGVNLQFCSLVVNYDLPWNPQRVEQRIGRCHRYGQRHDVVVVNFLNERNDADRRVLELLTEKFHLFAGVFGASDDVLGALESGVDFERRILAIYQQCRTPAAIEAAFAALRRELEASIAARMTATQTALLEHFDEDVHARLRVQLDDARARLDHVGRLFWALSRWALDGRAGFDEPALAFDLRRPPVDGAPAGRYQLIAKRAGGDPPAGGRVAEPGAVLYRLSHPLGAWVLDAGRRAATPPAALTFDVTGHPTRLAAVEGLRGRSGWLLLQRLAVDSYEREEYLLFSAHDDAGTALDQEACERLFRCAASVTPLGTGLAPPARLAGDAERHAAATLARSQERGGALFAAERDRLQRWADDVVAGAEKELADTKARLRAAERLARVAPTLAEQHAARQEIQTLERAKRRQRQRIFDVEDEIAAERDRLVADLERRLVQCTERECLFTIRWTVT